MSLIDVIKKSLGIGYTDSGEEFPIPRQRTRKTFVIGQRIVISKRCEDIALHGLTGAIKSLPNRTPSYMVTMDVDGTTLPFLPEEMDG